MESNNTPNKSINLVRGKENLSETRSQRTNKTADKFVMPRKRDSGYATPERNNHIKPNKTTGNKNTRYTDIRNSG